MGKSINNSFVVKFMISGLQSQTIKERLYCNNKVLIVMREAGLHWGTEKHDNIKKACTWLKFQGSLSKGVDHIAETWKP